jgi:hypothetical protein
VKIFDRISERWLDATRSGIDFFVNPTSKEIKELLDDTSGMGFGRSMRGFFYEDNGDFLAFSANYLHQDAKAALIGTTWVSRPKREVVLIERGKTDSYHMDIWEYNVARNRAVIAQFLDKNTTLAQKIFDINDVMVSEFDQ